MNEETDREISTEDGNTDLNQSETNNIELDDIDMLKSLINKCKDLVVVTGHRRENHGDGFLNICRALKEIASNDNIQIIHITFFNLS